MKEIDGSPEFREDPLAVRIGLWAEDIPADGWPETFDREATERILGYLDDDTLVL